jgi:hypothetical protein
MNNVKLRTRQSIPPVFAGSFTLLSWVGSKKSAGLLAVSDRFVESVSLCAMIAASNLYPDTPMGPCKSLCRSDQFPANPAPSEPRAYRQRRDTTQVAVNVEQRKQMKRQKTCNPAGTICNEHYIRRIRGDLRQSIPNKLFCN